jgi:hypothetical protein
MNVMSEHRRYLAERHRPRISGDCPRCGTVDVPPERVWLVELSVATRSFYSFICPRCQTLVRRLASARHRAQLRRFVATEFWQVPAEALEPRPTTPLTHEEALDILLALHAADWTFPELAGHD